MTQETNSVGTFVAEQREGLGLSREEFAARVTDEHGQPVSAEDIEDIESGRRQLKPDHLRPARPRPSG